jgi:hypothetical protein
LRAAIPFAVLRSACVNPRFGMSAAIFTRESAFASASAGRAEAE